eukprot:CAMPEP_0115756384 /NCGR_PEP_ID=MMETSP0272-20121206/97896_1 /TAXON_ID=71861 /ORGANISM="Scrippsiella trochoidea, Strain CCMP3099" /LENGTH=62 /DNA_ID=CAMNT_0003201897 /DNA_START=658 /DNA_END=846 /DNA_ORIENTATION=+
MPIHFATIFSSSRMATNSGSKPLWMVTTPTFGNPLQAGAYLGHLIADVLEDLELTCEPQLGA